MKKSELVLLGVALAAVVSCSAVGEASLRGLFTRLTLELTVGDTVTEVYVQPGEIADLSAAAGLGEGERVVCWFDGSGSVADLSLPVEESAGYTALVGPEPAASLSPWLELDEYGLAHPDAPVTGEEAARGVEAMFAGSVDVTELAATDEVSETALAEALEGLLSPVALEALDGRSALTRLEAADIIYTLYMTELCGGARGYDSVYRVTAADLDPLREGAGAMAACLDTSDAVRYDEGFVNLDGWLYRVDGTGLFYMDTEIDGLYYGPDGRYTSGSAELDALVAEALEPICAEYDTREEMLRAAYLYVRDSFTYLRRNYYEVGADGWQTDEAVTMLTTGRGNCYCYAAAFWALARGLGYDATAVAGTVGWDRSPHGWVIMYDEEGTRIIYDTELEMAYHYNRGQLDVDLYAMTPDDAYGWNYIYGEQFQ